jgi:hypothetical protein
MVSSSTNSNHHFHNHSILFQTHHTCQSSTLFIITLLSSPSSHHTLIPSLYLSTHNVHLTALSCNNCSLALLLHTLHFSPLRSHTCSLSHQPLQYHHFLPYPILFSNSCPMYFCTPTLLHVSSLCLSHHHPFCPHSLSL